MPNAGGLVRIADLGTWMTWTPTWTGSVSNPAIGNGTLVGRYIQFGRWVAVEIHMIAGSTTTFGSGSYVFDLPIAAAASVKQIIGGLAFDTSAATGYSLAGMINAGGTQIVRTYGPSNAAYTSAVPFAWGNTDELIYTGQYESV